MIGQERPVPGPPPLERPPARLALELEALYEDLVDPVQRLREAGQGVPAGVEVAAQDRGRLGRPEKREPVGLGCGERVILRRVEIRDDYDTPPVPHVDSLADTAVPSPVEALARRELAGPRLGGSEGPRVQADGSRRPEEFESA